MTTSPSQPALHEFVQPIARHKWLLLIVVVAAIVGAVVYSSSQERVYRATATIGFQGETPDLGVAGISVAPSRTPEQVALTGAEVVRSPAVIRRVRRALGPGLGNRELLDEVSTSVDANSNLVQVSVNARTAREAQRRANAFARVAVDVVNERSRANYAAQARALRRRKPKTKDASAEALSLYNVQLSRLNALSTISAPATVIDSSRRPKTPVSPKPIRNAVLGGFLGLVLGLSLVYLRDSLDRRLHSPREIESEMRLPLIGHVRHEALGCAPGANSRLSLEATDWEQFRIICRNLDFLDVEKPASSIAVTSSLPEEGKTTVALYVALASAAAGRRTLLIECDLRRPVLAERISHLQRSPGITDFVAGRAEPAEILQTIALEENHENGSIAGPVRELVCITAGSPTEQPVEILGSARFRKMLEQVRSAYEVVVLDTPPLLPVVDARDLLPHVGAVIVCVREAWTTRDQVRAGRAEIQRLPQQSFALVVTGTSPADERAYGYYAYTE